MTTTTIPTAAELAERLSGLDRLLTARQWERAAIVYAYTTNAGPGGQHRRRPAPPKMTMREFARQGFAGLSSNKSVEHYRAAWSMAINQGWVPPVDPGDTVELPDAPFPAWGIRDVEAVQEEEPRTWRPLAERMVGRIDTARTAVRKLAEEAASEPLTPGLREELRTALVDLQREAQEALAALESVEPAGLASV